RSALRGRGRPPARLLKGSPGVPSGTHPMVSPSSPAYCGLGAWETTMSRWIGVAFAAAWLTVPEAAMASPPVGPRDVVESAIVRALTPRRAGEVAGTPVPDRWREIRKMAGGT